MTSWRPTWRWAFFLASIWFCLNLFFLRQFPTVYIDEAENANHAYNLAIHHQALFSLYDGLYPPAFSELRYAWPVVIRPFYVIPLAGLIKCIGFSLVKGRLFSLIAGFLSLLLIYGAGCLLVDGRLGLAAMGILSTRFVFLYCSDRIRPEMLLCLCGLLAFVSLLGTLQSSNPWMALIPGFLAGIAAGIHTNGAMLILPVVGLLLLEKRWAALGLCVLGWAVGFTAFLSYADWSHFSPGIPVLFFQEFSFPSLLKFKGNILAVLASETSRYFSSWDFNDWQGGWLYHMLNGWQYVLMAAAVCAGCMRKNTLRWPAQFAAFLALGYACGVGQKAFPYVSVLEPYLALSLAAWLLSASRPSTHEITLCMALILALLPLGKIPALLMVAFVVLPKMKFQWALLIGLASLLTQASELRVWMMQFLIDMKRLWLLTAIAGFIYMAARTFKEKQPRPSGVLGYVWAIFLLSTLGTVLFAGGIAAYQPSFESICQNMERSMTPGSRVAGPQSLWIGLNRFDYRDIGGLVWYRLLTGEKDLTRPLKEFRPDYLIVSRDLAAQMRRLNQQRKANDLKAPTYLFPWRHRILEVLEVGPAYGGELMLIENNWTKKKETP